MAAVYLHNALYTRNPTDNPREISTHSRNISSLSNATLFTNGTHNSYPTEPLLASSPVAEEDVDQTTSPRDANVSQAQLRWDNPSVHLESPSPSEKVGCASGMKARRARWRAMRLVLEFIAASWAMYNAIRYFLGFAIFRDPTGQTFCIALGTSAGASFALTFCTMALSLLYPKLRFGIDNRTLTLIQSCLRIFSSIFLLGPAVANFALVFLWRESSNPALSLQTRCRYDIDVVWSTTRDTCSTDHAPRWSWWIVGTSIRLCLTIAVLAGICSISFMYPDSRRRRNNYRSSLRPSVPRQSMSFLPPVPSFSVHQPSDTSLNATLVEAPVGFLSPVHLTRSRSSENSVEDGSAEHASFGRSTLAEPAEHDRELTGFVDRFRSLISQITQETEEALDIARSDGTTSPNESRSNAPSPEERPPLYTPDPERPAGLYDNYESYDHQRSNDRNVFNLPPVPPALGYNEFGLPYPPDENVRFLNGLIRRMPTIESMGSNEIGSLGASSRANGSMHTSSRPPTRNTLSWSTTEYDFANSNPPSRSNSLSARAELLVGMSPAVSTSEHGELVSRESGARRPTPPSTPSSMDHAPFTGSVSTHESQSTNGSRSTHASYHTASTSSAIGRQKEKL